MAETMISGQVSRIEHYPELRDRMKQHLEETRRQANRIKDCLERLGDNPSMMKDAGGKIMAMGQALSGLFVGDEVVKGTLASYTFEQMEIASYRILIETAKQAGDAGTQRVCEEILREEEAMAAWLEQNMDRVTQQFLARDQREPESLQSTDLRRRRSRG